MLGLRQFGGYILRINGRYFRESVGFPFRLTLGGSGHWHWHLLVCLFGGVFYFSVAPLEVLRSFLPYDEGSNPPTRIKRLE